MTNEELAYSLLTLFKPFGPISSVKASRDQRGRPFGFIEYQGTEAARAALAYGPCLALDNRRIRVEPAKRQRKLCIKYRVPPGEPIETALAAMRAALVEHVSDEDFKLSLQADGDAAEHEHLGEGGEPPQQLIAAIVKFEEGEGARSAYEAWRNAHPTWTLTWINMDRAAMGSNVRNSGLVQLVPGTDGTVMIPGGIVTGRLPSPRYFDDLLVGGGAGGGGGGVGGGNRLYTPLNMAMAMSMSPPPQPIPVPPLSPTAPSYTQGYPSPRYTPTFEEEHFLVQTLEEMAARETETTGGKANNVVTMTCEHVLPPKLSMEASPQSSLVPLSSSSTAATAAATPFLSPSSQSDPANAAALADWLGRTLFVGRLNGQAVTLPTLHEHFARHGPLTFIRLYNRGAIGWDGVPLDAYAFIRFAQPLSVERAIKEEHGRVWLGQAIKCEHARPAALAVMLLRDNNKMTAMMTTTTSTAAAMGAEHGSNPTLIYPGSPPSVTNGITSPPWPRASFYCEPISPTSGNWFRASNKKRYPSY